MATFSKLPLSGSTNGKSIPITETVSAGNTLHIAQSGTSGLDEIWLYAVNSGSATVKTTIEYGGTETKDQIEINIPGESGLVLITPGLLLQNSLIVRAFAGTSDVISIHGYVNRIT